jgi:hypothetical protein
MESIDIGLSDLEPISLNFNDAPSSGPPPSSSGVNFGPGIELLMNDKKKSGSFSTTVDLGELDRLESELNNLSSATPAQSSSADSSTKTLSGFASSLFNFGGSSDPKPNPPVVINSDGQETTDSKLGHATVESIGNAKTWDGFSKMNDVPLQNTSKMSDREKRRKKRAMLKKLEEWQSKGLTKNSSHFDMDSAYDEIEDEYETVLEEKRKKDSIKLQGWWFMTFVNSVEYANSAFNPFDLNLDGWGEQVSEDIESYEEIFSELHEKYKGGKLSPELSLLLRLGFSAAVVNFTNKALSSATPGFNDVIRQSPELMKMFTNATVQSMNQNSPGFGFVNNILHPEEQANTSFGAPPAPMETKNMPPPQRPGAMNFTNNPGLSRPDIAMGRGAMFKEQGVEIGNNYAAMGESVRPQQSSGPRPEMRGPQNVDVGGLLSGLKTREVNIHNKTPPANTFSSRMDENDSMISISSLKDMQNPNLPKRANRRKQKSDRNTISLDI